MKLLSEFYTRMLPYLPGCPEPTAAQALVDSAVQFCETSEVLRETLDPLVTSANQSVYELDTPSQQQVCRVTRVTHDQAELRALVTDNISWLPERTGKPTHYYTTRNDSVLEVHLYPTPDAEYTLTVEAALRPVRGATALADDLYNFWVEPVVAGAMGRIMTTPNQPFSDPQQASSMFAAALTGASRARNQGNTGRVRGSLRVQSRPAA